MHNHRVNRGANTRADLACGICISQRGKASAMSVVLSYSASAAACSRAFWSACAVPIQEEGPLGTVFVHIYSSRGDVDLVAVNFFPDEFRITETSPSILCRVRLPNCASTTSQDQCSIAQSIGSTITTSLDVRFDYSITNEFSSEIKLDGIGGIRTSYSASYTFSEGSSFSESIEHTTTISRTFTVNGAPNTYTVGNVIVQEQTGSLPYELVFDFDGVCKSRRGMWTGVLASDALLHTQEYTPCTARPNE